MIVGVAQVLENTEKLQTKEEKIEYLRKNGDNIVLKNLLRMAYDQNLEWDLPPGAPPYKKNETRDQEGNLFKEYKRLYLFHKGQQNLKPLKREFLFVQLLETLDPKDAELLLHVKEKKLPYQGFTKTFINEVFPSLI